MLLTTLNTFNLLWGQVNLGDRGQESKDCMCKLWALHSFHCGNTLLVRLFVYFVLFILLFAFKSDSLPKTPKNSANEMHLCQQHMKGHKNIYSYAVDRCTEREFKIQLGAQNIHMQKCWVFILLMRLRWEKPTSMHIGPTVTTITFPQIVIKSSNLGKFVGVAV